MESCRYVEYGHFGNLEISRGQKFLSLTMWLKIRTKAFYLDHAAPARQFWFTTLWTSDDEEQKKYFHAKVMEQKGSRTKVVGTVFEVHCHEGSIS